MSIKEQIDSDFLSAYKAHEEEKVSVLRLVKSSIKNAEISKKEALSDSDVIAVLKKEIKQRKDSEEAYKKAGRDDAAEKELKEAELISEYLPSQLGEDEIRKFVVEAITELSASGMQDMGKVIGKIMQKHGDQVDGGTVSRIVKEELTK